MFSNKLSFNSDLPMDKIVWLYQGSTTANSWGAWDVTIPHKLQAAPFVKGVWTLDNWNTTWMTNARRQNGQYIDIACDVASDSTNVYLYGSSETANATIKYKLWGVWNENDTRSTLAEFTKGNSTNKFVINSDYNYPQLVMEGYLNKNSSINHGLDFYPQCDIWGYGNIHYDPNLYGYYQLAEDYFSSASGLPIVKITKNTLSLSNYASAPSKIYYRIYAS